MSRLWIDYMAPCDVFFFSSILKEFSEVPQLETILTARSHAETESLLVDYNVNAKIIGEHDVSNSYLQTLSFTRRNLSLYCGVPSFDISLSLANIYGIIVSLMRNRPSISIIDNDLIEYERSTMEKIAAKIHAKAHWIIAPVSYPIEKTIEKGANVDRTFTFDGYKEDIYIADYAPDTAFMEKVPFKDFIVIRPEALYSTYVHNKGSITPQLLKKFSREGINVVYLPRHKEDTCYIDGIVDQSNIWIPPKALNGLDLVYYSKAILTGSGTFAREAACMGKPAVSFFPDQLLAVDASLVNQRKMYHSLDPDDIVDYVLSECRCPSEVSFEENKRIKGEFISILKGIFETEKIYG